MWKKPREQPQRHATHSRGSGVCKALDENAEVADERATPLAVEVSMGG
jgi:hypothetical protein